MNKSPTGTPCPVQKRKTPGYMHVDTDMHGLFRTKQMPVGERGTTNLICPKPNGRNGGPTVCANLPTSNN